MCYYIITSINLQYNVTCIASSTAGAEAIPDIDVSKKKFAMNIILPSSDETGEIRLVFESVRTHCS